MKKQIVKYAGIVLMAGIFTFFAGTENQLAMPHEAVSVDAGVALVLDHTEESKEASSLNTILVATKTEAVAEETPMEVAPEAAGQ